MTPTTNLQTVSQIKCFDLPSGSRSLRMSEDVQATAEKTERVVTTRREDIAQNGCYYYHNCFGLCKINIKGLPCTIVSTSLCFWNPVVWYMCLCDAWKDEC